MDEAPILASDREHKIFNQVVALHGAPAFVRRAQSVQFAWDKIVEQCARQRDQWLGMVRMRLAMLRALAGEWTALTDMVSSSGLQALTELERDLRPKLRQTLAPATSRRSLSSALRELIESLEYFNQRWRTYLAAVDLNEVNRLRDDYNRFYVLEKECAVRSPTIARQGFRRLSHAAAEDLGKLFPPLPVRF